MTITTTARRLPDGDRLLTIREVALLFAVQVQTVRRWVREARIASVRTPGGQLRFRASDVRAALKAGAS